MADLKTTITSRLAAIQASAEEKLAELEKAEAHVRQMKLDLTYMWRDISLLEELLKSSIEAPLECASISVAALPPADAVKSLLAEHPEGLSQKEIVAILEDKIDSQAEDKKRLLYNTIFNLSKRGAIEKVDGLVRLPAMAN